MLCFHAQNAADEFQFLNALKKEYWLEDSVIVVERQTDRKELTIRVRGLRMLYEMKPYILIMILFNMKQFFVASESEVRFEIVLEYTQYLPRQKRRRKGTLFGCYIERAVSFIKLFKSFMKSQKTLNRFYMKISTKNEVCCPRTFPERRKCERKHDSMLCRAFRLLAKPHLCFLHRYTNVLFSQYSSGWSANSPFH